MQKGFSLIIVLVAVLIIGGLIGGATYLNQADISPSDQVTSLSKPQSPSLDNQGSSKNKCWERCSEEVLKLKDGEDCDDKGVQADDVASFACAVTETGETRVCVGGKVYTDLNKNRPTPFCNNSPVDETANWKTYTNNINNYQVEYPPNLVVTNGLDSGEVKDSALFDYRDPKFGLPQYYVSVISDPTASSRDINIYNSLSQSTINKIFALKVGDELDQQTTYDIGGEWNFPNKYKRLTDEIINGKTFLVLENPKWYGGSDRRLLIRENRKVYMIGKTYNGEEQLQAFKKFYLSFKFLK